MLNKVSPANAILPHISQQLFHRHKLMITWKNLLIFDFSCFRIFLLDNSSVILNDAGQHILGQNLLPQIVRHQPVGIGRIACSIVITLVEGQKPTVCPLKARAEFHLRVIHGKVHHAAGELKQQFLRAAIMLILIDRIVHILLGQLVFQLESYERQAVDKHAQIQRQLGFVRRKMKLARDAEDVLFI